MDRAVRMTAMTIMPARRMMRQEWPTEVFHSQLLKEDLNTKLPTAVIMLRSWPPFATVFCCLHLQLHTDGKSESRQHTGEPRR